MMKLPDNLAALNPRTLYLPLVHGRATALAFGAGPTVLCLHGFPDNCLTYRYQVEPLVRAGYRVVLPVMRGYEPASVQPDGRYYIADLADDILRWIDQLGEDKVHLVGHDWGGVTAWAVAGLAPDRLHTVTSIAIPYLKHFAAGVAGHPGQLVYSWYMNFFQLRGLADRAVALADWWFIRMLWRRWSPDWQAPGAIMDSVLDTLRQSGVKKASLGYYRCMYKLLTRRGRETRRLLEQKVLMPALLITGENDGCMDTRLFEATVAERDFPAGVRIERIRGAGHFVQLEKPDRVTAALLDHFRQHAGSAG